MTGAKAPGFGSPNVPLLWSLWLVLDGIWGVLEGSWGVLPLARYLTQALETSR